MIAPLELLELVPFLFALVALAFPSAGGGAVLAAFLAGVALVAIAKWEIDRRARRRLEATLRTAAERLARAERRARRPLELVRGGRR